MDTAVSETEWPEIATQEFPFPHELDAAVKAFRPTGILTGWRVELRIRDRGQGCKGLTLLVYPNVPDSYHPEHHVNTVFSYPVPAAAFNRESWEEWLWAMISETEDHERAEGFRFLQEGPGVGIGHDQDGILVRRPYKPAHADGWNPGIVRTVVSETVTNTPNAGRLVMFPCGLCGHEHRGTMGENFRIAFAYPCTECDCEIDLST